MIDAITPSAAPSDPNRSGPPVGEPAAEKSAPAREGDVEEDPDTRSPGWVGVGALGLSALGILGVTYTIYAFKFIAQPQTLDLGLRNLFVLSIAAALSPYLLALFYGRIPLLYLVAPTVIVFLLGVLMAPYGIPYTRDGIYNYQFALSLLSHDSWIPGQGVTLQAIIYSYYPGSGVFNAESSRMLGLPLLTSFPYAIPIFRLLAVPPALYAFTGRLVGRRAGLLSVLLYLVVPSIVLNLTDQQEFAIVFFLLTLLAYVYLLDSDPHGGTALRLSLVVFSSYVILSHHMTSYILVLWLGVVAFVPLLLRGRVASPSVRSSAVAVRCFVVFLLYTVFVTYPVVYAHVTQMSQAVLLLVQSAAPASAVSSIGSSFTEAQLIWIVAAAGTLVVLASFVAREMLGQPRFSFVPANLLAALALTFIAFALLPTGFSDVAQRVLEYSGVVLCPAAAWWLIRRGMTSPVSPDSTRSPTSPLLELRPRGFPARVTVLAIVVIMVTGGSLLTGITRDQFAPPSSFLSDSPVFITRQAYDDALWAQSNLNLSAPMWGDILCYTVFGGYGGFHLPWDQYFLFNGTSLTPAQWAHLKVGDYIVLDVYLTHITPEFWGPPTDQPSAPLQPGEVAKFTNPSFFHLVFADSTFSIYEVTAVS